MTDWQPIETAPRVPYHSIDLWVVRPDGKGSRYADAQASGNGKYWLTNKGSYIEGRVFYDDEGDECFDIDDRTGNSLRVTHWQPLPPPPNEAKP